jgi:ankyrin repeat protein
MTFVEIFNRFRWAFCQLETLRHCLPPSVHRTLDELPESLDETYERVLREIKKPNRDHARRVLRCLVVAVRPLRVEELAEVLAVDFGDAEGIPKLKLNWRWEDQEQALLTSCSSLIAIVDTGRSLVVQFSHFSVKEYLTSTRLATSSGGVSRYHVDLEPAHTILAQACMSVLLQADDHAEQNDVERSSPLAEYAAEHWVTHAQFQGVSSLLRKAMEYLFDLDKPYFTAWLQLRDIDDHLETQPSSLHWPPVTPPTSGATPLYYAAFCGFQDLVEHLVIKHPHHVNARGGHFETPLLAALARRHFQTAELLRHNGADVNVRYRDEAPPLQAAAWHGDSEMVRVLLAYKVDVNARCSQGWTPVHCVSQGFTAIPNISQSLPDVARLLLEHGADVNAQVSGSDSSGRTPLHVAVESNRAEVVRVLLEHGANVDAEDSQGRTPLHAAVGFNRAEVVRVLLEHGANVDAEDSQGRTPLHAAVEFDTAEVVRVLLEHGANVDAEDSEGGTPFQTASANGYDEIMNLLSEHGAK